MQSTVNDLNVHKATKEEQVFYVLPNYLLSTRRKLICVEKQESYKKVLLIAPSTKHTHTHWQDINGQVSRLPWGWRGGMGGIDGVFRGITFIKG